jgi:hypothetical protein
MRRQPAGPDHNKTMLKNKTVAAWLALLGGPLGLHRFYLYGLGDTIGWLLPIPTALGWYGVQRAQQLGLDDQTSWLLIPLLGFAIAAGALTAIVYGLMSPEKWGGRFSSSAASDHSAGATHWLTIGAIVCALLIGTTALMSSLAFSFQRYFEYQVEAARAISQPSSSPSK